MPLQTEYGLASRVEGRGGDWGVGREARRGGEGSGGEGGGEGEERRRREEKDMRRRRGGGEGWDEERRRSRKGKKGSGGERMRRRKKRLGEPMSKLKQPTLTDLMFSFDLPDETNRGWLTEPIESL